VRGGRGGGRRLPTVADEPRVGEVTVSGAVWRFVTKSLEKKREKESETKRNEGDPGRSRQAVANWQRGGKRVRIRTSKPTREDGAQQEKNAVERRIENQNL